MKNLTLSVKMTRFGTFQCLQNFAQLAGDIHPCPLPSDYAPEQIAHKIIVDGWMFIEI